MNAGLGQLQNISGAQNIPAGLGGQINLKGFYRKSPIDDNFLASENDRKSDAVKSVDVTYFMYTTGDTATAPNLNFPDVDAKYRPFIQASGNVLKMYSPTVTTFKIETTRPYFTDFGNLSQEIDFNENNFVNIL